MTTMTFPSRVQHNTGFFQGLRSTAVAFLEGLTEGLDMAKDYDALSRMSDGDLAKRGLSRDTIGQAVAQGRRV
jgi:hypothetical protein